jgi:hypothetical protein
MQCPAVYRGYIYTLSIVNISKQEIDGPDDELVMRCADFVNAPWLPHKKNGAVYNPPAF